ASSCHTPPSRPSSRLLVTPIPPRLLPLSCTAPAPTGISPLSLHDALPIWSFWQNTERQRNKKDLMAIPMQHAHPSTMRFATVFRSEERRVGKECRSRGGTDD